MYLAQNHSRDLLRREDLRFIQVVDLNHGASILINDFEWPRLDILLDSGVIESSADQSPAASN
jgi:hypothetical protein